MKDINILCGYKFKTVTDQVICQRKQGELCNKPLSCRQYKAFNWDDLEQTGIKPNVIEDEIDQLFNDAMDVNDTIWYSEFETLRDAIVRVMIHK